ncbi:hypothetical protein KIPB_005077 [Kipferlia bialata]|uniref:Uncharacterized protein n=1 Tax=Kipferlia bialata TaxID=797122 RepID=A0A391NL43_9EUKA|nr:hypothetical protein KIPB_003028 [Kipferlia bialata]GCA62671.1 hypothetical protein KIPB_005077 [Kipferlia bialata]|eukprot:g3028.t1
MHQSRLSVRKSRSTHPATQRGKVATPNPPSATPRTAPRSNAVPHTSRIVRQTLPPPSAGRPNNRMAYVGMSGLVQTPALRRSMMNVSPTPQRDRPRVYTRVQPSAHLAESMTDSDGSYFEGTTEEVTSMVEESTGFGGTETLYESAFESPFLTNECAASKETPSRREDLIAALHSHRDQAVSCMREAPQAQACFDRLALETPLMGMARPGKDRSRKAGTGTAGDAAHAVKRKGPASTPALPVLPVFTLPEVPEDPCDAEVAAVYQSRARRNNALTHLPFAAPCVFGEGSCLAPKRLGQWRSFSLDTGALGGVCGCEADSESVSRAWSDPSSWEVMEGRERAEGPRLGDGICLDDLADHTVSLDPSPDASFDASYADQDAVREGEYFGASEGEGSDGIELSTLSDVPHVPLEVGARTPFAAGVCLPDPSPMGTGRLDQTGTDVGGVDVAAAYALLDRGSTPIAQVMSMSHVSGAYASYPTDTDLEAMLAELDDM